LIILHFILIAQNHKNIESMKQILSMIVLMGIVFMIGCTGENGEDESVEIQVETRLVEFLEGDDTKTQTVSIAINDAAPQDMTMNVEIATNSTLTAGEDYTGLSMTSFTIPTGETGFSFEMEVIGDTIYELNESLFLEVTSDYEAFTDGTVQITINNDDDNWNAGALVIPDGGYETPLEYDGMTLVWQDEFEADTLNTDDWSYDLGDGCPSLCGWGNQELEFYRTSNLTFQDGKMIIAAKKEDAGGKPYTSTRINTKGKQSFKYGRIDIRASMPYGKGLWPALWMLGENIDEVGWPACGEIDIMEMVGGSNGEDATTLGTVHWDAGGNHADYGGDYQLSEGTLNDNFHVYSISWDEQFIRWYLDDVQYHEIDISPGDLSEFDEPFYFIFNIAVGGTLPGSPTMATVFPQYMVVDYVRVFQPN
jgi:hypothetical protein